MAKIKKSIQRPNRITELRIKRGISSQKLADTVGTTQSNINHIETGRNNLNVEMMKKIAAALGVAPQELLLEKDRELEQINNSGFVSERLDAQENINIPEIDVRAGAGNGCVIDNYTRLGTIPVPRSELNNLTYSSLENLVIFSISGDSMSPTLPDGARVIADLGQNKASPPGIYAIWDGYGLSVKRLQILPAGKIRIISDNPKYGEVEAKQKDIQVKAKILLGLWRPL